MVYKRDHGLPVKRELSSDSKMKLFLWLVACVWLSAVCAVKIELENLPERCDYSKCVSPDPKKLNVHLVPHTHDDVGWLKTVDQYYYGSRANIQKAGVQYILDSVVEELIRGKDRRFIYVETAFFWKWWTEQNVEQKRIFTELVKTGQLEFINGGWSMNDEATTHYNSIIDQMTWGHRRLNDTFGKCGIPKVAWQIDPFGHSREQANLFAGMNFDALFFARQDYQDKENRIGAKSLEHMWQGSDDLGKDGDLLTGMMKNHYGPLSGLGWDLVFNTDNPIIDNPESEEYNVDSFLKTFFDNVRSFSEGYPTNNVMIPMGEDFQYQSAGGFFKNMDKLIKAVNNRSTEVKVFYSTPSCYAKALHDSGVTFSSKADDFFPYASKADSYWTGYFTSRPAQKRFERVGNNVLQVCKQVDALAGNGDKFEKEVTKLREIMGVMQHHDAVAGTEKQHVADDYNRNLHQAITACRTVISSTYSTPNIGPLAQHYCDYLNISSCAFTETEKDLTVTLYNPLGHTIRNQTVRIPVAENVQYHVYSEKSEPVASWLVPVPEGVQTLKERPTKAKVELVFTMAEIPPLGLSSYFVKQTGSGNQGMPAKKVKGAKVAVGTKLQSKNFAVLFDSQGEVSQVQLADGSKVAFKNEFHYYRGAYDNIQPSGAYVFRPAEQKAQKAGKVVEAQVFQIGAVQEVHQKYDVDWISQVVRVVPDKEAIEFEWVVGPIPISGDGPTDIVDGIKPIQVTEGVGREIVARYVTDLNSGNRFWTDANGRQVLQRQVNYRPSWNLQVNEPVSGNYYPVNSRAFLRDENRKLQLTVLTDRSQGGTSLQNGTIELMVHRRLLHDDYFGVGEALNETGVDGRGLVVRGRHLVLLSSIKDAAAQHRELSQQLFMEPLVGFAKFAVEQVKLAKFQGLTADLPANVHLLTLEEWRDGQLLLRLEHFYQKGEDVVLSKPVTVGLKHLFKNFEIVEAKELTLSANALVEALKSRMQFKYTPIGTVETPTETKLDPMKLEVMLNPMQIRTFAVKVKRG